MQADRLTQCCTSSKFLFRKETAAKPILDLICSFTHSTEPLVRSTLVKLTVSTGKLTEETGKSHWIMLVRASGTKILRSTGHPAARKCRSDYLRLAYRDLFFPCSPGPPDLVSTFQRTTISYVDRLSFGRLRQLLGSQ